MGLILLILAFPVKNENHIAAHIAVALTLLTALSFIIIGILRGNAMIIVMGAVSFIAFDFYVFSFIRRKKQKVINSSDDSKPVGGRSSDD